MNDYAFYGTMVVAAVFACAFFVGGFFLLWELVVLVRGCAVYFTGQLWSGGCRGGEGGRMDFTRASELTPEVETAIHDAFEYHPWDGVKASKGAAVTKALAEAVKVVVANVPPSPDRSAAIRKIWEARMDCNSAITHEGKYGMDPHNYLSISEDGNTVFLKDCPADLKRRLQSKLAEGCQEIATENAQGNVELSNAFSLKAESLRRHSQQ